jgi:hypothetical protein
MKTETRKNQAGVTMIELLISLIASFIIIFSIGRIAMTNQSIIALGQDQARLQQEVTRLLTTITRDVHASQHVVKVSSTEFRTLLAGGVTHTYQLTGSGAGARLQRDGVDFVDRTCNALNTTASADSTGIEVALTLTDARGNTASGYTTVTVRNSNLSF